MSKRIIALVYIFILAVSASKELHDVFRLARSRSASEIEDYQLGDAGSAYSDPGHEIHQYIESARRIALMDADNDYHWGDGNGNENSNQGGNRGGHDRDSDDDSVSETRTHDVVVIGAGATGSVVLSILSSYPSIDVAAVNPGTLRSFDRS